MRKIIYSLAVGALVAGCAAGHAAAAPPHGTASSPPPHGTASSPPPHGTASSPPPDGTASSPPPHGTASSPPPLGTVTGRAQLGGGALGPGGAQPRDRPLPGTVEFESAGRTHRLVTVAAGPSGTFLARLAPGTYRVTVREQLSDGRFREQPCAAPQTVTVVAGRTAAVTLTCIVP
jgi:hypothetical protein